MSVGDQVLATNGTAEAWGYRWRRVGSVRDRGLHETYLLPCCKTEAREKGRVYWGFACPVCGQEWVRA